jgi:hypothetical protein
MLSAAKTLGIHRTFAKEGCMAGRELAKVFVTAALHLGPRHKGGSGMSF